MFIAALFIIAQTGDNPNDYPLGMDKLIAVDPYHEVLLSNKKNK